MFDPPHHRRSLRLKGFDYASNGAYFLTICVHERKPLFGVIADGEMRLNAPGQAIESEWRNLTTRFADLVIDELIVMPNHLHGILAIAGTGQPRVRPSQSVEGDLSPQQPPARPKGTQPDSIGRIIQAFKSISTNRYVAGVKQFGWPRFNNCLWQRNYYDHIIRSERSFNRIREYIATNPQRWSSDYENLDGDRADEMERFIQFLDDEYRESVGAQEGGEHEVRPYGGSRVR